VLIPGDYFAINSQLTFAQIGALGFPVEKIASLSHMVASMWPPSGRRGIAGRGMASIIRQHPRMKGLMPYWYNFALMFEALFILTTVDAGTGSRGFDPGVRRVRLRAAGPQELDPRHDTIEPGVVGRGLSYPFRQRRSIWPMFGVSNNCWPR